jgi:type I restriction enzyme S subunit
VFQPKPGVDPRFVFYVAASQEFTDLANASSEGTRMPRASWSVVKDFEIRDTPIEEQRVIAATLGALDDKIESNLLIIARGLELLDAMAAALTDSLPFVELRSFALLSRATVNPVILKDQLVDHFSLPAFDVAARPERVPANSIMSNKILLSQKSVLVSRLNPRTNRTWWAKPHAGTPALASTEFACLQANGDFDLAALWLAVRVPGFHLELVRRVTGTSGSHQRVRPEDLLSIEVPDVGRLDRDTKERALGLLELVSERRVESVALDRLRDSLLPELLSGRMRVPVAQEDVA